MPRIQIQRLNARLGGKVLATLRGGLAQPHAGFRHIPLPISHQKDDVIGMNEGVLAMSSRRNITNRARARVTTHEAPERQPPQLILKLLTSTNRGRKSWLQIYGSSLPSLCSQVSVQQVFLMISQSPSKEGGQTGHGPVVLRMEILVS